MSQGFWNKLKKPIFALAPMADVTDAAFRRLIAKYGSPRPDGRGKPDVCFTEFVSVDGLCSAGRERLLVDLKYSESERPIVAQIFGSNPEKFEEAARLVVELGFDGIDINMGCPVKKVLNQNSCSALIRTPELAKEIILATKRGAGNLPVSVKTRIGFNKVDIETWIPQLLETDLAALTLHLRTVKEMSKVPAHWELMKRIVELRNESGKETLILGNGDAKDLKDARQKVAESECDGVMLGRAIFGNPWLFKEYEPTQREKLAVLREHIQLFDELLGGEKSFALMKKHFKAYVNGFDGAAELRAKLMETETSEEAIGILGKVY